MKFCHCTMGGTRACKNCPNNPNDDHIVKFITSKYAREGEWIVINDSKIIDSWKGLDENEQRPD